MSKIAGQIMSRKKGLGRGLGAIINDGTQSGKKNSVKEKAFTAGNSTETVANGISELAVERIQRNAWQPRTTFDEQALAELADSIRIHGVLQPLLVRKAGNDYELLAGERRLRAAGIAGLQQVPAIIMDVSDSQAAELALIENLQRENLDPLEEACGYRVLMDQFGLTQEDISRQVGRARATVANALRLLTLPQQIREWIKNKSVTPGHAKLLLGVNAEPEQMELARMVIKDALSVRQLENIIQRRKLPRKPRSSHSDLPAEHTSALNDRLQAHFGTAVRIHPSKTYANGKKGKGWIEIDYYSNEDLHRLLEVIGVSME